MGCIQCEDHALQWVWCCDACVCVCVFMGGLRRLSRVRWSRRKGWIIISQLLILPFYCVMGRRIDPSWQYKQKKGRSFLLCFVVFVGANSFNSDLRSWDVSKVRGMEYSEYATCLLRRCCLSVSTVVLFVCLHVGVFVGLWVWARIAIACEICSMDGSVAKYLRIFLFAIQKLSMLFVCCLFWSVWWGCSFQRQLEFVGCIKCNDDGS